MIESTTALASGWLAWMISLTWQLALLVGLLSATDRLLGDRLWPQLRHALWLLVLVKLVLPPGLPSLLRPARLIDMPPTGAVAVTPGTASPWVLAAMAIWIAGALIVGLTIVERSRRLRRRLEEGSRPAPVDLQRRSDRVAVRLGLRRGVSLRITPDGAGPLVIGLWRPIVFVPARVLQRWSATALEHVLCHELAHVRRRDLWVEAAFTALAAAHWFHPAVWWARHQAHALREMCCDATAAACSGPGYRAALVRVSADTLLATAGAGVAAIGGRRSWMLRRLRALERDPAPRPARRRLVTAGMTLALGAVLLPMGARQVMPDLDQRVRQATQALVRAMSDAPEMGSLHVRYAVMQLNALEAERAAAGELSGSRTGTDETD